jgi:RND family efflux transporter MFP subunit
MNRAVPLLVLVLGAADSSGGDGDVPADALPAVVHPLRDARVAAEVGGRVIARPDDESAAVEAGEPVVALDDALYRVTADAARAEREQALARRDWAALEHERVKALHAKGAVGQAELDRAAVGAREAEAGLRAAEARAADAELRLARTKVRAPFSGKLVRVPPQLGEYLAPGQEAFRIVDASTLRIVAYAPGALVSRLVPGDEVRVEGEEAALPPLVARIFAVAPAPEGRARTFRVEARVADPSGRWRAGMTARIRPAVRDPR